MKFPKNFSDKAYPCTRSTIVGGWFAKHGNNVKGQALIYTSMKSVQQSKAKRMAAVKAGIDRSRGGQGGGVVVVLAESRPEGTSQTRKAFLIS
jgi:hypothetical protein